VLRLAGMLPALVHVSLRPRHRTTALLSLTAAATLCCIDCRGCPCGDDLSIECYCSAFTCLTYEEAFSQAGCDRPLAEGTGRVRMGCGLIEVSWDLSLGGTSYVYSADDHELVGASNIGDDSPYCSQFAFSAGPSLADCGVVTAGPRCATPDAATGGTTSGGGQGGGAGEAGASP